MNLGKENEFLEFKESTSLIDDALDDMSAILNKWRRGTLYFGVRDDGEVIGTEVGKKTEAKIAQKISQCMEPTPYFSVLPHKDETGRAFIEVPFHGEDVPYAHKGIYYIRQADKSSPMPTAMLRAYFLGQQTNYEEWEASESDISLDQIDEKRLRETMDTANRLGRIKHPYIDKVDALRYLRLLTKNGVPNKACELLFSTQKPYSARLAAFSSFDKSEYVDMRRSYGNIFELIDESYDYILFRVNGQPLKPEAGLTRATKFEIPPKAIREILVNAFAHARYGAGAEQEIGIYPNRLSIYNPGIFPPGYTPEQFAKKEVEPIDRNGRVTSVLYFSDYAEHFGTGFTTAFDALEQAETSYSYYSTQSGFVFEFYRKGILEIKECLGDYAQALNVIKQDNYITKEKISAALGVSVSTVSRLLEDLQSKGKLTRVGARKNGHWMIL